ncbi:retinol dehydrogenase 11-like isoform X2 [Macrobrachium nipponense]|uniref:retinol dehydrogenase 11-like isoform X2 n=1 Tax=Macrobrachium nipponense TaxID=159736 RepID=UPI0030C87B29
MEIWSMGYVTWATIIVPPLLMTLVYVLGILYRFKTPLANVDHIRMDGKTVVITGASAGIGKEAARDMARRGARVILGCRNIPKSTKVAEDIQRTTGNKAVFVKQLDTSSLTSVRRFADQILAEETRIDVLILNAGIAGLDDRNLTADGLEYTMATNHFGHFLLTNILLGRIKESKPSRVVVVSSDSLAETVKIDNLNFEKGGFGPYKSYCQSKSCNVLFSCRLAQLARQDGVIVNSMNPGLVYTEIFDKSGGVFVGQFFRLLVPFLGKTEVQGAQTIIYLAAAEETGKIAGKFFEDCKISSTADALLRDEDLAKQVWEASESLVSLQPNEKHY